MNHQGLWTPLGSMGPALTASSRPWLCTEAPFFAWDFCSTWLLDLNPPNSLPRNIYMTPKESMIHVSHNTSGSGAAGRAGKPLGKPPAEVTSTGSWYRQLLLRGREATANDRTESSLLWGHWGPTGPLRTDP